VDTSFADAGADDVSITAGAEAGTVHVAGRLNVRTLHRLTQAAAELLAGGVGRLTTIDLSGLVELDAIALAALVNLCRVAAAEHQAIVIRHTHGSSAVARALMRAGLIAPWEDGLR
jgi:ABC-type transporter Mla MlaB component